MRLPPRRVFLGFSDVCDILHLFSREFAARGSAVFSWNSDSKKYYQDSDYSFIESEHFPLSTHRITLVRKGLNGIRRIRLFLKYLSTAIRSDLFLYFYYGSKPTRFHLLVPKVLGKPAVSFFWGSEIRCIPAMEQDLKTQGHLDEVLPFVEYLRSLVGEGCRQQLRRVRLAERYSALIFSQRGYAQLQNREYLRAMVPVDVDQIRHSVHRRKVPVVVHAPSRRGVKGTEYVLRAVENLKRKGIKFDFRLIENMRHNELLSELSNSDVVVDQLFSDTVATFALESMAAGNAVLARYYPELTGVPEGCPVIHTTMQTIEENLERIICDQDWRYELSVAGRRYVEMYHRTEAVIDGLLAALQQ